MTPTARTLALLRAEGWTAQVVERWNAHARIRQDLFAAFDVVAIRADVAGVLGVQCTSGSNVAARVRKLLDNPAVAVWLQAGNSAAVWGWARRGPRGKRKTWSVLRRAITLDDLIALSPTAEERRL
jgi:hypothetical protein